MRRIVLILAAMALPVSALTVGLAGQAGAASKITCTTMSGSASGTTTISGCTGGVTGGSSHPLNSTALATGGTISWVSGSSTTIGAPTLTATSAKKCPGYVKGASSNPTADKFVAAVTADTGDGIKVPGSAKGAVCIAANGTITALKPLGIK
jgi:hypothetical protein